MIPLDWLVNDFAVRSFRDIADGDYIAARMACRAALVTQFLWASQQAVEKYLKCILLLNRIEAKDVRHNLGKALSKINGSGKVPLGLTNGTQNFIVRLDQYGQYRYLEVSNIAFGTDLVNLDRAVGSCAAIVQWLRNQDRSNSGMALWLRGSASPVVILRRSSMTQRTRHGSRSCGRTGSLESAPENA